MGSTGKFEEQKGLSNVNLSRMEVADFAKMSWEEGTDSTRPNSSPDLAMPNI